MPTGTEKETAVSAAPGWIFCVVAAKTGLPAASNNSVVTEPAGERRSRVRHHRGVRTLHVDLEHGNVVPLWPFLGETKGGEH